jgi:bis(5'-adenosyl)-triphosphatase
MPRPGWCLGYWYMLIACLRSSPRLLSALPVSPCYLESRHSFLHQAAFPAYFSVRAAVLGEKPEGAHTCRTRTILMAATAPPSSGDVVFGTFLVPATSIFYRSTPPKQHQNEVTPSATTIAFVNLRPIVPGHVLVIPERIVPDLKDLTESEYLELWTTVRIVQNVLRKQYKGCTAFNIAVQDGRAAGQSVPHVHVHVLPRYSEGDYYGETRNDEIYEHLQEWAPREDAPQAPIGKLNVPQDGERRDRTRQEMADEAALYRAIVESKDA